MPFFYSWNRPIYGPEVMTHPTPCGIHGGRVVWGIAEHHVQETERQAPATYGPSVELHSGRTFFEDPMLWIK